MNPSLIEDDDGDGGVDDEDSWDDGRNCGVQYEKSGDDGGDVGVEDKVGRKTMAMVVFRILLAHLVGVIIMPGRSPC